MSDGWLWVGATVGLAWGGTACQRVLTAAAVSAGLANILLIFLKGRVRRLRPCDTTLSWPRDVRPVLFFPSDRYSFPSGHALNAFAVGSVLTLAFPAGTLPLLLVAASVASSRVFLGLHFLSDVLAGSAIGILIGVSVFYVLLG